MPNHPDQRCYNARQKLLLAQAERRKRAAIRAVDPDTPKENYSKAMGEPPVQVHVPVPEPEPDSTPVSPVLEMLPEPKPSTKKSKGKAEESSEEISEDSKGGDPPSVGE